MKNKFVITAILTAIVFGGGGFFSGMKYQQGKPVQDQGVMFFRDLNSGQNQAGGVAGGRNIRINGAGQGGFMSGEIIAKDDKSVTIKLPNGGSKIIFYSGSTEISKSVSGISGDLEIGKTIMANGSANSDGSITAQTIQIRPMPIDPSISPAGN